MPSSPGGAGNGRTATSTRGGTVVQPDEAPRRMRRFRDMAGNEYDELPGGLLRRRLESGEQWWPPSGEPWHPYPTPQSWCDLVAEVGHLSEVDTRDQPRGRAA